MSAPAERRAFAAIGRDLFAGSHRGNGRRAAALTCSVGAPPTTTFAALDDAPVWLRWPHERRSELARLVALRSMAPALAASIDGTRLGALAASVGEPALDWAIAMGRGDLDAGRVPGQVISADDLTSCGLAILGGQLPHALRGYLGGTPARDPTPLDARFVADALVFLEGQPA